MTSSKQKKFTYNPLLKDIKGSWCCVFKVCQYILFLQYYAESHAVIYIVDSCDKDRIEESKDAFGK